MVSGGNRQKKFFDLEFLPSDLSVYNHINNERPLDLAIHWRRPDEFVYELLDLNRVAQKDKDVKPKKSIKEVKLGALGKIS